MSATTRIKVTGMSCDHCVRAVTEAVHKLAGVTGVEVDLATGTVQITSDAPLADADLRAAIDEAGYEIAS